MLVLESFCVTQYVAVSGDEPAYFARNWIVAVALGMSDVPTIDVHARRGLVHSEINAVYWSA